MQRQTKPSKKTEKEQSDISKQLSDDIWLLILAFMDLKTIALVAQVSKRMHQLTNRNSLWFCLFNRDHAQVKLSQEEDYKKRYQDEIYVRLKNDLVNKIPLKPTDNIPISCYEHGHSFSNFINGMVIPAYNWKFSSLVLAKDKQEDIHAFVEFIEYKFIYVLKISLNKRGKVQFKYLSNIEELEVEKQNIVFQDTVLFHQSSDELLKHLSTQIDKSARGHELNWGNYFLTNNEANNNEVGYRLDGLKTFSEAKSVCKIC